MLERFFRRLKKDTVLPQDRTRTANLTLEIRECLEYFDQKFGATHKTSVHGIGITIGRLEGTTEGYFWETDGVVREVGKDIISDVELSNITKRIHNITFSYADHVKARNKKK